MNALGRHSARARQAAGPGLPAGPGARPARRWLVLLGWLLGTLAAFAVYLRLARTRAVNSDGASQALQAWDMLHGNPLLRGWQLTDVSFYTTELPQYMLVELVRGFGQDVVHVAAAMTYTLAVLFAALLAKGTASGREAAVRVALAAGIMLAPQLDSGTNVLLSSPDHIGTSVPVMAVLVIIDRARPRWWVPAGTSLLLAWATVADSLVLTVAVAPLFLVCAFRVLRATWDRQPLRSQWYEISLGAGAVAGGAVGLLAVHVIGAIGGFSEQPLSTQLSPIGTILGHNLAMTGQGLLLLAGADFLGLPRGASTGLVMLHLAGVAVAACGIAVAACRFPRDSDMVTQVLLAGIVINVAAYLAGTHAVILGNAREMAPVLPFAAALAGRQLAGPLLSGTRRRALRPALTLVLAGYLAGLGLEISHPAAPPQDAQLTAWLRAHPLGTGLSGYWEGNAVTLTSGGQTRIRPLTVASGNLNPTDNTKAAWYHPATSSANFVVLFPGIAGYPGFTSRAKVLGSFGQPARIYHVGRYTILYWHKNLLTELP
ncbi:MAG: hypothetical protein ABSA02_38875 [Trebonia sp.]|jgi:hypothetical protein